MNSNVCPTNPAALAPSATRCARDSAYSRNDIMSWCARGIDYVFGLAGNERLGRMTLPLHSRPKLSISTAKSAS